MGTIKIKSEPKTVTIKGEKKIYELYSRANLRKFNPKVLDLGDIDVRSSQREAIAAVFDLEGFTNFCKQVDPYLSVPKFLNTFLSWLFDNIKKELIRHRYRRGCSLYTELPFFAKFLGDGVLFLWDAKDLNMDEMCNTAVSLENICRSYKSNFVPRIRRELSEIPPKLRCGVAMGMVCSVGNGEDFIGPCINIASRLQKLSSLPFCFSMRGFDLKKGMVKVTADSYIVRKISIKGIGGDERVCVSKVDFEKLKKKEQDMFEAL